MTGSNKHQADNGRRRLSGGPIVPASTAEWWEQQWQRIERAENFCSFPLMMTRVAHADFDMTIEGVREYRRFKHKRKP